MLFAEAVIAEVLGAALLSYSSLRHLRGSEGMGIAVAIWALVIFVAIPFTKHAIG